MSHGLVLVDYECYTKQTFVICLIMTFREMWAALKKTRFVSVKLKNHLYITHDGVLNAFHN